MLNDFIFLQQTGKEIYPYNKNPFKQKMSNLTLNEELFDTQFELREERKKWQEEYEQYQAKVEDLQRKIKDIEAAALQSVLHLQKVIEEKDNIIQNTIEQYEAKMYFYADFFGQSFKAANDYYYYSSISTHQIINDFTNETYIFENDVSAVISQLDNEGFHNSDSGYSSFEANEFNEYEDLMREINEAIYEDEENSGYLNN